jgi:hypothetical protein
MLEHERRVTGSMRWLRASARRIGNIPKGYQIFYPTSRHGSIAKTSAMEDTVRRLM